MFNNIYMYLFSFRFAFHFFYYFKNQKIIDKDLQKQVGHSRGLLYQLSFNKSFRALFYKRCDRVSGNILNLIVPSYPDISIDRYMHLGKGCCLIHAHGTHLHAESIGDNFTCLHNVTLGVNNQNKKNDLPTIGNNVLINTGAVVVGKIKIGNNVIIGANSVVTKDVDDNCVIGGVPARVIRKL